MAAINDKHSKSTRAGFQIKKQADQVSAANTSSKATRHTWHTVS
jgi:hypothetical protein